jgi:hypothetical protein
MVGYLRPKGIRANKQGLESVDTTEIGDPKPFHRAVVGVKNGLDGDLAPLVVFVKCYWKPLSMTCT